MVLLNNELGKRKRPREEIEDPRSGQRKSNAINVKVFDDNDDVTSSIDGPLEGVVACLSGFAKIRKDDLHQQISALGGR